MRRRIRLAMICPDGKDATSFYRAHGPLGHLRTVMPELEVFSLMEVHWASLALTDAVFLQRPFRPEHALTAQLVKRQRVPLWVDFDDALLHVPESNPTHIVYGRDEVKKAVAECAALADVITVSTKHLADLLAPLNKRIVVVPNAWDDRIFELPAPRAHPGNLILWRGSNTHRADLNVAAAACMELAKDHPDWTWLFAGDAPWFADFMPKKQVVVAPAIDLMEYMEFVKAVQASIMVVPLVDDDFNRAKSNIAWIEGTHAGAAVIAPAFPEWVRPGITNYDGPEDFKRKLQALMGAPEAAAEAHALSREAVLHGHLLSQVNATRASVIRELVDAGA